MNEEDPIKNEGARVLTRLYIVFQTLKGSLLQSQRWNSSEIELIQAFMVFLVTCKNEEIPIKNEGFRVLTRFSPL